MTAVSPRLVITPAEAFGRAAADEFVRLISELDALVVGLPTGNTPLSVYAALHEMAEARPGLLATIRRAFAIDEYVCPRDHPASNRAFFARHWSTIPGAPPVEQFDPEAAALDAEAVRMVAELAGAGGLDIAVVGVGTNGHLAFNEPGSAVDSTARLVQLAPESRVASARTFGPDAPRQGLTLGLSELLGARRVLLLANGPAKATIVARALRGPVTSDCPASFLQQHQGLTVVLDEAAAGRLDSPH
ncbi:MAG: glucosamine-6-phosphate deaminase [Tepidiformaceae bacterium]